MYLVIRKDLLSAHGFPTGSVIAQGAHAATKAIWAFKDLPSTVTYLSDIKEMHKVVLETKNLVQLQKIITTLRENKIDFVEWNEQPEDVLTCIATRPYEVH